jgi:apolipoprotein N-acyltransferase
VEEYMDNKAFLKTMLNLLFVGALFFLSIIFWLETGTRTNTPLSVVLLVLFAFILAANIILGKQGV